MFFSNQSDALRVSPVSSASSDAAFTHRLRASVGKSAGREHAMKSGVGSAAIRLPNGLVVAAIAIGANMGGFERGKQLLKREDAYQMQGNRAAQTADLDALDARIRQVAGREPQIQGESLDHDQHDLAAEPLKMLKSKKFDKQSWQALQDKAGKLG
mgnify:CR=1 FL=1